MIYKVNIFDCSNNRVDERDDHIAIERAVQLSVNGRPFYMTMCSGNDLLDLAYGFLFTEGIISKASEVTHAEVREGGVSVTLSDAVWLKTLNFSRSTFANSACGVCGKESSDQLFNKTPTFKVSEDKIFLKNILDFAQGFNSKQKVFKETGGVHACAIVTQDLESIKEDVGRHNALDKLIGSLLRSDQLPLDRAFLFLSGRISFELVQKAIMAGIGVIASFGAPSSLALDYAMKHSIAVVGFIKNTACNIYTHKEKIMMENTHEKINNNPH